MCAYPFRWLYSYLVAGLCASGLHSGQTIVISRYGVVMFNALLGTALFVDFHQWQGWRVVLYQPHLRWHCHHSGHWRYRGRQTMKTGHRWEKNRNGRAEEGIKMERSPKEKKRWGRRKGGKERGKRRQWHTNSRHLATLASKQSQFYHSVNHRSKPTTKILQSWETAALNAFHLLTPKRVREGKGVCMGWPI